GVPLGWAPWTTGNRTHILAFTSPTAMSLCLDDPTGTYRSVPFHPLAAEWPNEEWWLAINPGLPIEAYLPAWFMSQLTRGDVRLPGRTALGSQRIRMAQSDLAAAINGRIRAAGPHRAPSTTPAAAAHPPQAPPSPMAPSPLAPASGGLRSTGPVRPPTRPAAAVAAIPAAPHDPGVPETIEAEIIDSPPSPPSGATRPMAAAAAFSAGRAAA